jgi:hypothetical protein
MKRFKFQVTSGFEVTLSAESVEAARMKVINSLEAEEYSAEFHKWSEVSNGEEEEAVGK